jgi:hypothetical protein
MEFVKAVLEEVADGPGTQPAAGGARVVVQINPATLRLQMASTVDFGKDTGRQKVQYQGSTSTLSFDLVFDTADEGTTEEPVDVRTRTRQLERFVLPAMKKTKAVPPRVQFTYGSFAVIGVMTVLNQDFDFFARNGVPLRAKCAVTIKEQRPEFDATKAGPGANTGAGAVPPLPPGAANASGPGAGGAGEPGNPPPDRSATALAGESAPDLAARMGLDPHAWKGLRGITDPLSLPAGLRVDFASSLSATGGLGVDSGAAAGVPPGDPAQVGPGGPGVASAGRAAAGAGAPASGGPVPAQPPADGTALASAGGLTQVLAAVAAAGAGAAAEAARQGFVTGPGPAPARPATVGTPPASPDPRALGYGFGVPLRPRIPVGHAGTPGLVSERRRAAAGGDGPPETDDPTVAGWLAVRAGPAGVDCRPGKRTRPAGCGCGCGGTS